MKTELKNLRTILDGNTVTLVRVGLDGDPTITRSFQMNNASEFEEQVKEACVEIDQQLAKEWAANPISPPDVTITAHKDCLLVNVSKGTVNRLTTVWLRRDHNPSGIADGISLQELNERIGKRVVSLTADLIDGIKNAKGEE